MDLAWPSLGIYFVECGGIQLLQIFSGMISPMSNLGQSIIYNIYSGMLTFYIGFQLAIGILVGIAIGECDVPKAK
jgi:Na+-driven multidrug efflux pump